MREHLGGILNAILRDASYVTAESLNAKSQKMKA